MSPLLMVPRLIEKLPSFPVVEIHVTHPISDEIKTVEIILRTEGTPVQAFEARVINVPIQDTPLYVPVLPLMRRLGGVLLV